MLRMGGTQPVRKGSVPWPGVGWESGDGLGKIRGSEGQSVGLSMAGCGGSGDKGQRGLRGGSHGGWLGKGREEGWKGGGWGEPPPCHVPTGTCCSPYGRVGQEGVGVEDGVVGDVISAEVEEPCQERDLCA